MYVEAHIMNIKFANTDGDVFQPDLNEPLNIGIQPLGTMLLFDDDIIIVDRKPNQITSQLFIRHIVSRIRYLLSKVYLQKCSQIHIYMPRMNASPSEEALAQAQLLNLAIQPTGLSNPHVLNGTQPFQIELHHV